MADLTKKNKKTLSREIGIEIASICGRHFLHLEHLHYGYWTPDLQVDVTNLRIAQENYANFLLSHIPKGIHSILDVGCGMGTIAKKLIDTGYAVDCVVPSPFLAQQTRMLLPDQSKVFECTFEQLQTDRRYDLVLFSESFQYIDPEEAIKISLALLNPDGFLLICDVFKAATREKCPLSGGHHLSHFFPVVAQYPLGLVEDVDITAETAPTLDMEDRIFREVAVPVAGLLGKLLDNRHPVLHKVVKWMYRRKIEKVRLKYLGKQRTAEMFRKYKTYRLFLYKANQDK